MEKQNVRRSRRILINAVIKQNYAAVNYFLQNGSDVNDTDTEDNSPLHHAILKKNFKMIELLLQHNACIDLDNPRGETPYGFAIELNDFNILKILLRYTEKINMHHHIKLKEYPADLKELFYRKLKVKNEDNNGYTALHHAIKCDDLNGIRMLISRGAHVNKCTWYEEFSPLHLATSAKCIELLLQKGAKTNIEDFSTGSPLYAIAIKSKKIPAYSVDREEQQKMIETLCRNGADCVEVIYRGQKNLNKLTAESRNGLEHVLKLMALLEHERHYVKINRLRLNDENNLLSSFYKRCLKEVIRLQKEKISDYLSYYDFATKNTQKLLKYVNNKSILKAFKNKFKIKSKFPIYNRILIRHFNEALEKWNFRKTVCSSLSCITPYINAQHVVTYQILNYLGTEDMKNLVKAFQPMKSQNNK